MYKLSFFVPEEALERVKTAVFTAGAGKIGKYDQCCWQVKGRGQFRPLVDSDPTIGEHGEMCTLTEWKVEMVCDDGQIRSALIALKAVHPYEEVAYEVVRLVDVTKLPTI